MVWKDIFQMGETSANTTAGDGAAYANFLQRMSAFIIDFVLIYFFGYTLELGLRDVLLQLGPGLPILTSIGVFCYFWLANGPVGRGRTLGKQFIDIRTVNEEFGVLGYGPAFKRALLQVSFVFPAVLIPLFELLGLLFSVEAYIGQFLYLTATSVFLWHGFSLLIHPRKRTAYDLWANSYVAPDGGEIKFKWVMQKPPEEEEQIRLEFGEKLSFCFFALVGVVMLSSWAINLFRTDLDEQFERIKKVEEGAPMPGFRLGAPLLLSQKLMNLREEAEGEPPKIFMLSYLTRTDAVHKEDLEDPQVRANVDALREFAFQLASEEEGTENDLFFAQFTDSFIYFMFPIPNPPKEGWQVYGPLNPASGDLTYEWVDLEAEEEARKEKAEQAAGAL